MNSIVLLRRKGLGKTSCEKIKEYSKTGIQTVRNDSNLADLSPDILIRWGCTSKLKAEKTYNKAEAIHCVSNKTEFRKLLMKHDPETIPHTFFDVYGFVPYSGVIVRPETHSQGKHVYLVKGDEAEFYSAKDKCGPNWYASEYIKKVAEYRITFCQGRVVWIANKIPSNVDDIAWNVAQGGKFENVKWSSWPINSIRIARRAFTLSGLDFGAVDIMVDGEGRPYVLEINSAPSMTSPYRQQCMALALDYMVSDEKPPITIIEGVHWKDYIHPAVLNGEKIYA